MRPANIAGSTRQFIAWVIVGTVCAIAYLGLAMAGRRLFNLTLLHANWLALVLAQLLAYFLHKYGTFGASEHVPGAWRRFAGVAAIGLAISTATTLGLQFALLSEAAVLAINCVMVPALNFLLLKLWVFVART